MRGETTRRRTIAILAALAGFVAAIPAAAQDLGDEWQSLTAAEWSIVFPAPGLDRLIERHQLSKNVDSSYRHEVAFWSGRTSSHPKAVIHFMKTHSDIAWRNKPDPRTIGDEGNFKEKSVTFGSLKKDRNRLGRVEWRIFHFDNVTCVGFAQVWGDVDQRLAGDKMVIGYYCADPGKSLSEDAARRVVTAIDIADTKDRRRQLAGKSTGPFDGLWTGRGENYSGDCRYRGLGRSFKTFALEILVRNREITGRIKGLRNSYGNLFPVDVSVQGTVNESGELDLQVSRNNLSVDLVLQGKFSKDGNKASGEWDAPNCHGTLTLTRKFPF